MRKIIISLLCCITLLFCMAYAASAYDATYTIESADVLRGDTVDIQVKLSTEKEFNTVGLLNISYDTDVLTFVKAIVNADFKDACLLSKFDKVKMAFSAGIDPDNNYTSYDGEIFTLRFTVNEDAPFGSSTIAPSDSILKKDSEAYDVFVIPGTINIKYYLTYDANGGSGAPAKQEFKDGSVKLSDATPVRTGYDFLGWAESPDAKVADYQPGETVTSTDEMTLYAVWKIKTYTVSYDANGGTNAPETQIKTHGVNLTLASDIPELADKRFDGWATTPEGEAVYYPGQVYADDESVTLYAVWKNLSYTVTFDSCKGQCAVDSKEVLAEDVFGELPTPERYGYEFLGWFTEKTAGTQITATDVYDFTNDITLYAHWKVNVFYDITYSAEGANNVPPAQVKPHDTVINLDNSITPTKDGFVFVGWSLTENATEAEYMPGDEFAIDADTVLYAVWMKIDANFYLDDCTAIIGKTVKVGLYLKTDKPVNTFGINNLEYDRDIFTFNGFSDYETVKENAILSDFDNNKGIVTVGLEESTIFDGFVCYLNFTVAENASEGFTEISADSRVKNKSQIIISAVKPSKVRVRNQILGDIDCNEEVTVEDAILLLQHSLFSDDYPIDYTGNIDFTQDGNVDIEDAILLLQYSMFPDDYPLE